MVAKEKPPVITDPMAFIRGATEPPERVVIGDDEAKIGPKDAVTTTDESRDGTSVTPAEAQENPEPPNREEEQRFPWENANPKVKSYFQLRMPEPLGLKLKFIKQNTLGINSVHDLVMQTLEAMVEERLAEILKQQGGAKKR